MSQKTITIPYSEYWELKKVKKVPTGVKDPNEIDIVHYQVLLRVFASGGHNGVQYYLEKHGLQIITIEPQMVSSSDSFTRFVIVKKQRAA